MTRSFRALALSCSVGVMACAAEPVAVPGVDASTGAGSDAQVGDGGVDAARTMGTDASGLDASATAPMCPPEAPFGRAVGETMGDLVLLDCDGVERSLHSLCDRQAVWLFEYADWCPPCRSFASSSANRIDARFAGPGFASWMIVSEDDGFGPPDAETCRAIRERYGITMPVLFDPEGRLQSLLGVAPNEVHVVLTEGARIDWIGHYAGSEVESRIESALAR